MYELLLRTCTKATNRKHFTANDGLTATPHTKKVIFTLSLKLFPQRSPSLTMATPLTDAEIENLRNARISGSKELWNEACEKVKAARYNEYPCDWVFKVMSLDILMKCQNVGSANSKSEPDSRPKTDRPVIGSKRTSGDADLDDSDLPSHVNDASCDMWETFNQLEDKLTLKQRIQVHTQHTARTRMCTRLLS